MAQRRHLRSTAYDLRWVASLDMGPHPLWQLEDVLEDVPIAPGARVLDLGCGKGATSVFLAQETGAQVTAFDLWIPEDELRANLDAAGVGDRVQVVNGDARRLPFADAEFYAVISIDAFEYFGTDVHFLPSLLRVVKPGGHIGVSTPALRVDPYDQAPPAYVTDVVGWQAVAWHSPEWWQRHWALTGRVRDIRARMQDGGRQDWISWSTALGEAPDGLVRTMLDQDDADLIGFALVSATVR